MTSDTLTIPHNLDAEAALLGCALIDPVVVADCADVAPEDFYRALHSDIWAALRRLGGAATDWVTIAANIRANTTSPHDGLEAYLQELGYAVPTSGGYTTYAALVKDAASRRRIITVCRDAAMDAYNGVKPSDAILGQLLSAVGQSSNAGTAAHLPTLVALAQEQSNAGGITGIKTGLPSLDAAMGGMVPGRLIVVGARPGQGKSSLIAQMGVAAMDAGAGVLMFSLEMSGTELATRMICSRAGIDSAAYMQGRLSAHDKEKAARAAATLNGSFYIDETCNLDIAEIRLRTIRHRAKHGDLGLVVVDYLGLAKAASASRDQRYLQVGAVSQGLKQLAKELHLPVIAAHQINRDAEAGGKTGDARPRLSQLRESGNIEQDADQALLIWPFQNDPRNGSVVDLQLDPRPVEVALAKNRHGAQALLYLNFRRGCTRFEDPNTAPPPRVENMTWRSTSESKGADYE